MTAETVFPRHHEVEAHIAAPAESVFYFLDDPARLTDHMSRSSWIMGGGRMSLEVDAGEGRRAGSKMILRGHAFGVDLHVEEVVTERSVPVRKVWETFGTPRLWVMANYRLGFEITAVPDGCRACVFIDYVLPASGVGRWLGLLFGSGYAKWCTDRMLVDASAYFARLNRRPQPAS